MSPVESAEFGPARVSVAAKRHGIIQGGEVFGHGPLGLGLELLSCFNPALTLRVGD
ncbi:hypothetical protein LJN214_006751 [Mesorhizobium sp. LjNodule214]